MELGLGKRTFPAWTAAGTLLNAHGRLAVDFVARAIKADDLGVRLDASVRALTSFDHAIDSARKLPFHMALRSLPAYYLGYDAARQAVTALVASGLIPGARERVGYNSLLAGRSSFLTGVPIARVDHSRYGAHLSTGWFEAALEDATVGVKMLDPASPSGRALVDGVNRLRIAAERRSGLDEKLVEVVEELFKRATNELSTRIPNQGQASGPEVDRALAESARLLEIASGAAQAGTADAPSEATFDNLAAAG